MDGVASLPLKCTASAARAIFASQAGGILILVLMEYGLRADRCRRDLQRRKGLNPCFNGIWSASLVSRDDEDRRDSLNPCFNGIWSASLRSLHLLIQNNLSLNPCFNGIWSASVPLLAGCFNRCFVLILVLMEYGLRVYRWKTVERETPAS